MCLVIALSRLFPDVPLLLAGIGAMLAIALLRLVQQGWRETLLVAAALAAIAVLLWAGSPALIAVGNWNLLFFFVLLVG